MATATAERKAVGGSKGHFVHLTAGKLMGLRQITDEGDRFKVLALDQSNSFRKALRAMHEKEGSPVEPSHEEILATKLEMVRVLAPHASATLLDVTFGARQSVASFSLPRTVGLIVRSEASRDAGLPSEYEPGWSVEKIKRMGAAAVKLLVYLDTGDKKNVKAQIGFVEKVAKACAASDILLMTEELTFPRQGEDKASPAYQLRRESNILEATRLLGPITDILKLEFPGDIRNDSPGRLEEKVGRLNEAALRPWVLLSAGENFDLFVKQAEAAIKGGCSGYMAGRAIFKEYFNETTPGARAAFLASTGVSRMQALNRIVEAHATPWPKRYGITAEDLACAVRPDWYLDAKARGAAAKAQAKGKKAKHAKGDY